jgi:ribosomal protein S18 acetylase RimI-like enzyme
MVGTNLVADPTNSGKRPACGQGTPARPAGAGSLQAMDEGALRLRLWDGFARLQTLLGGHAGPGAVLHREGLVASVVPSAPESPTLNAAVAIEPERAPEHLEELRERYRGARVRRWGIWLDAGAAPAARVLANAGMMVTTASPGMGARLDEIDLPDIDTPAAADLATVGRVNDLAYGNLDSRLERTLAPLPNGILHAYRADHEGQPAAVAMALHHDGDCGVSFVATVPQARRRGLARHVMLQALTRAREQGCTTTTLQATDVGERLYANLGYRRLCVMQLWERRR